MQQYTEILQIKVTPELIRYLTILNEKYGVKRCDFVRIAIVEKLKRDVPKLRIKAKKQPCPF